TFTGTSVQRLALRLTSYHNLSALVTCHTLYVVFTTWQSAVFLVYSRLTHFTATPSFLLPAERKSEFRNAKSETHLFRASTFGLRHSSFLPAAKRRGYPFFRSYGARLPSSLTRFHSRA